MAGAALTVGSPDEAPPPGRLPGPGSNVSALARRGRQAWMPGWAALPGTGALSSQLCRRLLGALMAESRNSRQELPTDDGNDDNNDNKCSEFQWSLFVGRLFFASC